MQWEAQVSGTVRLSNQAGNLGVDNVKVSYNFTDASGSSSVWIAGQEVTDGDGRFTIHIITPDLVGTALGRLEIKFSKQTVSGDAVIEHEFSYNNVPTNMVSINSLKAFSFDRELDIIDRTSLPFHGSVYIAGTGGDNRWGTAHNGPGLSSFHQGCPLENVTVCLFDVYSQSKLSCSATDLSGKYSLHAAGGTSVYVEITSAGNHEYELLQSSTRKPSGFFNLTNLDTGRERTVAYYKLEFGAASNSLVVDFADISREQLTVQVAGGHCNHSVGISTVVLSYPTCGDQWLYEYEVTGYDKTNSNKMVPAQFLSVTLKNVARELEGGGRQSQPQVVASMGTDVVRRVDLSSGAGIARWVFHGKPKISVSFDVASDRGCGYLAIPTRYQSLVTVTVVEQIDWMHLTCDWVEGRLPRIHLQTHHLTSSPLLCLSIFSPTIRFLPCTQ